MTLRVCLDCTTAFAVGAPVCPHCGSERHAEEGSAAALGIHVSPAAKEELMPKITRHGGASIAGVTGADTAPEPDAEDTAPAAAVADYETWTVDELKQELSQRHLTKTGKRDDLVLRLMEDDEARAAEPPDTTHEHDTE